MPRRIQSLTIPGPAGRLEALFEIPEHQDPVSIALVCHPHPQHGGTMHNKVVYRIARALRHAGAAVLRFNFRGVNLSEGSYGGGEGELEDAHAALDWLRAQFPDLPYTLAGFSFGSRVVLRLGCGDGKAARIIAVGFPAASYATGNDLANCLVPKVFIQSTGDQYGSVEQLRAFVSHLPEPKSLHFVEAKDHFFLGALDRLEAEVAQVLS